MATTSVLHLNDTTGKVSFIEPEVKRSNDAGLLQGALYAMMGTALGLLAGTAAAMGPWSGNTTVMAHDTVQVSASAPAMSGAVEQSVLRAQLGPAVTSIPAQQAPMIVPASYLVSLPHAPAVVKVHHIAVKPMFHKELAVSPVALAVSSAPAAPLAAVAAPVSAPQVVENNTQAAQLTMEGDLTVADFDATTGTVETREGRNFTVAPAGADGNTLAWQDYAGNIHYRCSQTGNCTLSGSGVSASNARIL